MQEIKTVKGVKIINSQLLSENGWELVIFEGLFRF